jgi:hypothetical protein
VTAIASNRTDGPSASRRRLAFRVLRAGKESDRGPGGSDGRQGVDVPSAVVDHDGQDERVAVAALQVPREAEYARFGAAFETDIGPTVVVELDAGV